MVLRGTDGARIGAQGSPGWFWGAGISVKGWARTGWTGRVGKLATGY